MQQKNKDLAEQLAISLDDPIEKARALIESAQGGLNCLIESIGDGQKVGPESLKGAATGCLILLEMALVQLLEHKQNAGND